MGIEHEQEADVAKTDVWQLFIGQESIIRQLTDIER